MVRLMMISEPGFAGVKRHVVELLHNLDLGRFQVCFLYSSSRADGQYESEIDFAQRRGIECVKVGMVREISPLQDMAAMVRICREVRRFAPDIVHVHSSKAGFLGRMAAFLAYPRAKRVYSPHALACHTSRLYWILEKIAGFVTDYIVGVSPSELDDIRRWKLVRNERTLWLPLCVKDPDEYPRKRGAGRAGPVVVACGRICWQKRPSLFFEAAKWVAKRDPTVSFKWVGDYGRDEEATRVRELAARDPEAGKVEVTGWVSQPNEHIVEGDVFCMCSRYESFGYVTADAMMMRVPVVGIAGPGTEDLVQDGSTGLLLSSPTPEGLGEAILNVIQNRDQAKLFAENAYRRMRERFSRTGMLEKWSCFYETIAPTK